VSHLLEIDHLRVALPLDSGPRAVIHDLSLDLGEGEALAIVGESGAGKSMTVRAILRMLPGGATVGGEVRFAGQDLRSMSDTELRRYRADWVGVVFQDPRAHINPLRRLGDFMLEPLVRLRGMSSTAATKKLTAILGHIGISDADRRFRQYPHELSGGLLQRMMIASVVAMEPRVILADEPTTALDATTQSDVMAILGELRRDYGLALLLVTHDLDLAAGVCERMAVMYAGAIVEEQPTAQIMRAPLHPYTAALAAARPALAKRGVPLPAIAGRPLSAFEVPEGCSFAPRCRYAREFCREQQPELLPHDEGRAACLRVDQLRGTLARSRPDRSHV
jgi:oligopeptide/dipeptide ABC transporter ATP-binding protein